MRHFAFPHFFSPSFPIVVFCLRLHICLSRLQTFALFDLFWIGEGAKEEEKRTKTRKIGFVTFAARFIHFCRKEIWFSLWNRTARTREWVSFQTTLSIAILPPNDMVWGFLPLFLLLKVASAMQLKFNYCTCIAVKMGQVNTFFVCLFVYHFTHKKLHCRFFSMQCRNSNEKSHRKNWIFGGKLNGNWEKSNEINVIAFWSLWCWWWPFFSLPFFFISKIRSNSLPKYNLHFASVTSSFDQVWAAMYSVNEFVA